MYIEEQIDMLLNVISNLETGINSLNTGLRKYITAEKFNPKLIYKNDELLTAAEIAKLLKCNVNSVNGLMKAGILPYLILGSRKVRRNAFEKFLLDYEGWDLTDPFNPKPIN